MVEQACEYERFKCTFTLPRNKLYSYILLVFCYIYLMKIKELKLEISQELMDKLEKAAQARGSTPDKLICSIISDKLGITDKKEDDSNFFPEVALIKGNHRPKDLVTPAKSSKVKSYTNVPTPAISNEKIARKQALEEQMKELSLLVQTAENESKRDDYLMQYAALVAELDALL